MRNPVGLERGAFCNRPTGRGRGAHDLKSTFGASHLAPDQRAASPVCAGPDRFRLPLDGQGAPFKDPSSHNVRRFLRCWQPSRAPTHGLFITAYGALRLRGVLHRDLPMNLFTGRHEFGDRDARDLTKSYPGLLRGLRHAHKRRSIHVQGVGPVVQEVGIEHAR